MGHLFIRKNFAIAKKIDPRCLLASFALFAGAIGFAITRNSMAGYIASFGGSFGVEPVLLPVAVCLFLIIAEYFGVMSSAALAIVPCICAASGFAVQSAAYTYSKAGFLTYDFLLFCALVFAYVFSVLFVAVSAIRLSKSIHSCIKANRVLKSELTRYQIIFLLIVLLLTVSGYFVLV